jgi:hypothetical protein
VGRVREVRRLRRRVRIGAPNLSLTGRIRLRADAGYFTGQLARAGLVIEIEFAIGAPAASPRGGGCSRTSMRATGPTQSNMADALPIYLSQCGLDSSQQVNSSRNRLRKGLLPL